MAEGFNARETLLVLLGMAVTLLLTTSTYALYRHEYAETLVSLLIAGLLAYIFFRKRKVLLTIVTLTFLLLNAGLNNFAHPSVPGYLATYGAAAGLCFLVWWRVRKRARMGGKVPRPQGAHKLFDKDHGDEL
jgi:hypothetical protein